MEKKEEVIKVNIAVTHEKSENDFEIRNNEAREPLEQARQPKIKTDTGNDWTIKKHYKLNGMLRESDKKKLPTEINEPKCDSVTKNKNAQLFKKVGDYSVSSSRNEYLDCIVTSSQKSKFVDMLSQPALHLSHKECLIWIQERRETGIWVQCNRLNCLKWRYLANVNNPTDLPEKWYCEMNPDMEINNCQAKEEQLNVAEEEDLIHNKYTAGSVVWAKQAGYPWWPAMVDDCVDTEQFYWLDGFSDIPTHYNTVFFDSKEVTRAWIAANMIKPYKECGKTPKSSEKDRNSRYQFRINVAQVQADEALKLPINKRLQKYSFIARYKGPINSPTKEGVFKKPKNNKIINIHKNVKKQIDMGQPPHQCKINLRKTQSPVECSILEINQTQIMTEDETMETKPRKQLKVRLERIMQVQMTVP